MIEDNPTVNEPVFFFYFFFNFYAYIITFVLLEQYHSVWIEGNLAVMSNKSNDHLVETFFSLVVAVDWSQVNAK